MAVGREKAVTLRELKGTQLALNRFRPCLASRPTQSSEVRNCRDETRRSYCRFDLAPVRASWCVDT